MTLTQPDLRPMPKGNFRLWEDWTYEWEEFGIKCRTVFKAGQVTDIASIPKALWWVGSFQPDGLHRAAAVWHDAAYSKRGIFTEDDLFETYQEFDLHLNAWVLVERTFTREECDRMFLKIMLEAGESAGTAKTMFLAVRIFGRFAW